MPKYAFKWVWRDKDGIAAPYVSGYHRRFYQVGEWMHVTGRLSMCENGFHYPVPTVEGLFNWHPNTHNAQLWLCQIADRVCKVEDDKSYTRSIKFIEPVECPARPVYVQNYFERADANHKYHREMQTMLDNYFDKYGKDAFPHAS